MTDTFDYVIVGAGSAGCVLANRLSEDAITSICVLEAGPRDWHPYIHLPAGFIKTFHMKGINWAYQQEPGPWTGGRSIYAPRGKTLGGSSSINGHIQEGVSYAQRTIKNGLRVSAATAFLHPAMKRPNVHARVHAHATEILFEGKRAVGVRYVRGGRRGTATEVRAKKEVILAGGAYNSPQLLQLSGF